VKKFPDGFLWGASTSAMQVEGGIENNDWAEAVRLSRTPPIGKACDFYTRYESDLDIAKNLHLNAFRFSIEWSRIEPEEGKFDEIELEHYRQLVRAVRARGMEPFVTLWHFSLPLWFVTSGAFRRSDAPEIFARYSDKVARALGRDVTFYLTMNEPMVWLGEHGKIMGASPGFWPNPVAGMRTFSQLVRSHIAAFKALRRVDHHTQIGIAKHNFSLVGSNMFGKIIASLLRGFWNRRFFNEIRPYQDFIGIQFYQRIFFWQTEEERAAARRSDIGWQMHPHAIYDVIMEARHYKKPIYITESGVADAKDQYRSWFITESLNAIHRSIENGADVRGYFHWSLLDNYEFTKAYTMRFGLVAVNHDTQERTVRESAKMYGEVAKTNTLSSVHGEKV
jgi:beta-glucosidase